MAKKVKLTAFRTLYGDYGVVHQGGTFEVSEEDAESLEARGLAERWRPPGAVPTRELALMALARARERASLLGKEKEGNSEDPPFFLKQGFLTKFANRFCKVAEKIPEPLESPAEIQTERLHPRTDIIGSKKIGERLRA